MGGLEGAKEERVRKGGKEEGRKGGRLGEKEGGIEEGREEKREGGMVRGYVSEKHFIFQSTYSSQINERTVLYKQQCTHLLLIIFIYNLIFLFYKFYCFFNFAL